MENMSYCRFENTLKTLRECHEAMYRVGFSFDKLSESEKKAAIKLIQECFRISEELHYGRQ